MIKGDKMTQDEEIKELRELLWLNHGHYHLYGDDGEMQCSDCGGLDFKRHPIEIIVRRFEDIAFQRMVEFAKETK
jgi:hypothetical protein